MSPSVTLYRSFMPIRGSNLPYVKHSFAQLKTFFITSCLFSFFFFFFQKREKKFRNFFFFPYFRSLIHIFPTPRTRSSKFQRVRQIIPPIPSLSPILSLIIFRILFFEPRHSANFPREKVLPTIFQNFTSFRESFYFRIFEKQPR